MNGDETHPETAAFRNMSRRAAEATAVKDGSFPLIALLQLASFSAVLVACVDGRELAEVIRHQGLIVSIGAGVVSAALGFLAVAWTFAFDNLRRVWRSALGASIIGGLHGPALLAVYAAPAPFWRAGPAVAVLLLSTILLRVRSA
jgi:hypothetical protein